MTGRSPGPGSGLLVAGLAIATLAQASCDPGASSPRPFDAPLWELASAELRIESDGSGAPLRFIESLVEGPDGRIHSLHGREPFVRSWSVEGRPAGTPGAEAPDTDVLPDPKELGVFGDTLWVADELTHRVRFFGPGGESLGMLEPAVAAALGTGPPWHLPPRPVRPLRDGTFLGVTPEVPEAVARGDQRRTARVRMAADGTVLDTVWIRSWRPHDVLALPREGGGAYGAQPFGDEPLARTASDGALVVVDRRVDRGGEAGVLSVTWIALTGDTLTRAVVSHPPLDLEEARVGEAVSGLVRHWGEFFRQAGDTLGMEELERRVREALFVPAAHPPVTDFVVGVDGSAWLRRPGPAAGDEGGSASTTEWWVVGPDGDFRARVAAPPDVRILWAGPDHVLGTVEDPAGSIAIVRHAIQR